MKKVLRRAVRKDERKVYKEGRKEGQHKEKERVATDMLKKNFPLAVVKEISRLSEDAIRTIAANLGIAVM